MCTCIGQYVVFSSRHPISLASLIASIQAILPSVVKLALLLLGKSNDKKLINTRSMVCTSIIHTLLQHTTCAGVNFQKYKIIIQIDRSCAGRERLIRTRLIRSTT